MKIFLLLLLNLYENKLNYIFTRTNSKSYCIFWVNKHCYSCNTDPFSVSNFYCQNWLMHAASSIRWCTQVGTWCNCTHLRTGYSLKNLDWMINQFSWLPKMYKNTEPVHICTGPVCCAFPSIVTWNRSITCIFKKKHAWFLPSMPSQWQHAVHIRVGNLKWIFLFLNKCGYLKAHKTCSIW